MLGASKYLFSGVLVGSMMMAQRRSDEIVYAIKVLAKACLNFLHYLSR